MPILLSALIISNYSYLFSKAYHTVREMFLFGSRKSAKTKHIALRIVIRMMQDKNYNALAMRKIASELTSSVKEELDWAISVLGVAHLFKYKVQKREFIYLPFGNKILLRGISINPTSGKPSLSGLTVSQGWIQDCWMEEAWEFNFADYQMIRQTLRGGTYTMLIVGNPYFAGMWCVKRALELLPQELEILKTKGEQWAYFPESDNDLETIVHWNNFLINTKLSKEDIQERWQEAKLDPKMFLTTGYGMAGAPMGSILGDLYDRILHVPIENLMNNTIEFKGGLDVGLENDATACVFGGIDSLYNITLGGEYYHSNGKQQANAMSNNGVWKWKSPTEIADDVIEFYVSYHSLWSKYGELEVLVDNADSAFIDILKNLARQYKVNINFKPTKGKKASKTKIERRIIFERHLISRGMLHFAHIDGTPTMTRLAYEIQNLPWKQVQNTGQFKLERDDSKVEDHITNAWEYFLRPFMQKVSNYANLGMMFDEEEVV